jgi:hypothetical protein
MSFRFELSETGSWVFAFDAVPTKENVELDEPIVAGTFPQDVEGRRRAHDRLLGLRGEARLVPGHCPWTWRELRQAPDSYA